MKRICNVIVLLVLMTVMSKAQQVDSINNEIKKLFIDTLHSWDNLVSKAKKENKHIYLYYHYAQFERGYELKEHFLNTTKLDFFIKHFIIVDIEVGYSNNKYFKTIVSQNFIDSLKKAENLNDRTMNLIYSKSGRMMSKFNFNFQYVDDKIKRLKEVLKGKYDYYGLTKQFYQGNRNPDFIREFYRTYKGTVSYFREDTLRIFEEFLKAYPNEKLYTKANGKLVFQYANYIYDEFTTNLFLNREMWYPVIGKNKVDSKLIQELSWRVNMIQSEYFRRVEDSSVYKAFMKYKQEFKNYDEFDSLILYKAKARFYRENKMVVQYINTIKKLLEYGTTFKENDGFTNEYTWVIFKNVDDKKFLKATRKWCKKQLANSREHYYLDTYANLLYKIGFKNRAINFETKVLKLASATKDIDLYKSILVKMKNSEPTW